MPSGVSGATRIGPGGLSELGLLLGVSFDGTLFSVPLLGGAQEYLAMKTVRSIIRNIVSRSNDHLSLDMYDLLLLNYPDSRQPKKSFLTILIET